MALIKCGECGKEISDQATSCPSCGSPARASAPATASAPKKASGGRAFVAIGAVALLAFSGWFLLRVLNNTSLSVTGQTLIPAPRFEFGETKSDTACSKLLDHCVRVSCTVKNAGNATGNAAVRATYEPKGKPAHTKSRVISLGAGQEESVTFDFMEAGVADEGIFRCEWEKT